MKRSDTMPVKQTKPRKGSKPMVYFRGSLQDLKKTQAQKLKKQMERAGVSFRRSRNPTKKVQKLIDCVTALAEKLETGKMAITEIRTSEGVIPIRIIKGPSGNILIHQMPHTHGVRASREGTSFENLINILSTTFRGKNTPNSVMKSTRERISGWATRNVFSPLTENDRYSIELNTPMRHLFEIDSPYGLFFVKKAHPRQIVSINVLLDENASAKVREQKMRFYREQIQKKFGVPIKFVEVKL